MGVPSAETPRRGGESGLESSRSQLDKTHTHLSILRRDSGRGPRNPEWVKSTEEKGQTNINDSS